MHISFNLLARITSIMVVKTPNLIKTIPHNLDMCPSIPYWILEIGSEIYRKTTGWSSKNRCQDNIKTGLTEMT